MIRVTTLLIIFLTILTSACTRRGDGSLGSDAPADAVPPLEGNYAVNGFDPLGTEYSGTLTIFPTDTPGVYNMQWIIVGSIQEGQGLLDGNRLHAKWTSLTNINETNQGTATYTVTVDGELYGTRTVEGIAGIGTETAYPDE